MVTTYIKKIKDMFVCGKEKRIKENVTVFDWKETIYLKIKNLVFGRKEKKQNKIK